MFDFKTYERTHNVAVDMVAACVYFYRKKKRALKQINLRPGYYDLFKEWVAKEFGEEQSETMQFEFDSVAVKKGSIFQSKILEVEFWPEAQA